MNWFRRLCLFVFGLSGILALAALSLTLVGPWTAFARTLLFEKQWYLITLEVLVCITGLGLLVCLVRALFMPRNPRETIVAEVEGGSITVTRTAIVSQTRHIIEASGLFVASSVRVRARKRGHVRVNVRIKPRRPVDVVAAGEDLYARLEEGLAKVCGQSVKSISIVFTEPEQADGDVDDYGRTDGGEDAGAVQVPAARLGTTYALPTEGGEASIGDEAPSFAAESGVDDASVALNDPAAKSEGEA